MVQIPSREADSLSISQEISCLLWSCLEGLWKTKKNLYRVSCIRAKIWV